MPFSFSHMNFIKLIAAAMLLSACAQEQFVQRQIHLTGGTASNPITKNIQALINKTNTSYVTLGVFDHTMGENAEGRQPVKVTAKGSGFVVDEASGLVITAAHVAITRGWTIKARGSSGRLYQGRVLKTVRKSDTALIRFNSTRGLTRVQPASNACLKPGTPVFSLGKPSQKGDTARIGTVKSMSFGRAVKYFGYGYNDAMVVRLLTEKGESGGPLFDAQGRLVGMVVSTVTNDKGRPIGLAHAITLPQLAKVICSIGKCSSAWRAHLGRSTKKCPG